MSLLLSEKMLCQLDGGALDAGALLTDKLQNYASGPVSSVARSPQASFNKANFSFLALQREMRPGWRLERYLEGSQHQAGAEGARGPHQLPPCLPKGGMELEGASGRQMDTLDFLGLKILTGCHKPLLPPLTPILDKGPVAPELLGKLPPLVGESG